MITKNPTKGIKLTLLTTTLCTLFATSLMAMDDNDDGCCCWPFGSKKQNPEHMRLTYDTTPTYQAPLLDSVVRTDTQAEGVDGAPSRIRADSSANDEKTHNRFQEELLTRHQMGKFSKSVWKLLSDANKAQALHAAILKETNPDAFFNIKISNDKVCKLEITIGTNSRTETVRFVQ